MDKIDHGLPEDLALWLDGRFRPSWHMILVLIRLRLRNPKRANRMMLQVVDFGIKPSA